ALGQERTIDLAVALLLAHEHAEQVEHAALRIALDVEEDLGVGGGKIRVTAPYHFFFRERPRLRDELARLALAAAQPYAEPAGMLAGEIVVVGQGAVLERGHLLTRETEDHGEMRLALGFRKAHALPRAGRALRAHEYRRLLAVRDLAQLAEHLAITRRDGSEI